MPTFGVILAAAGKSTRYGDAYYKKPFATLENRPVWLHAADKFCNRSEVKQIVVVIAPEDKELFYDRFGANIAILGIDVVEGGAERSDSIAKGLEAIDRQLDFVAVHDAARPCLTEQWIDAVFQAAITHEAAMLATPITGTMKRVNGQKQITETVSREGLWEAQTPQVFRRSLLEKAYAQRGSLPATDDAQLVERLGHKVVVVPCSPTNLKITTKEDLRLASAVLKSLPKPDILGKVHPFAED